MKPLKIVMSAFCPYADRIELDLSARRPGPVPDYGRYRGGEDNDIRCDHICIVRRGKQQIKDTGHPAQRFCGSGDKDIRRAYLPA